MQTSKFAAVTGIVAGVAITASFGTATAAAATPVADPGNGRVGVTLTPAETFDVSDGPIPALVQKTMPAGVTGVHLEHGSNFASKDGYVHASLRDVLTEAADHSGGYVDVLLTDPDRNQGTVLRVYQHWH